MNGLSLKLVFFLVKTKLFKDLLSIKQGKLANKTSELDKRAGQRTKS